MTLPAKAARANVPCNGCTACCENDLIMLYPEMGDDPQQYLTMPAVNPFTGEPGLALQSKPKGGCIYLGPQGCMIHDRAPAICREFDCRALFRSMGRPARRRALKSGMLAKEIMNAGRDRLHTLEAQP